MGKSGWARTASGTRLDVSGGRAGLQIAPGAPRSSLGHIHCSGPKLGAVRLSRRWPVLGDALLERAAGSIPEQWSKPTDREACDWLCNAEGVTQASGLTTPVCRSRQVWRDPAAYLLVIPDFPVRDSGGHTSSKSLGQGLEMAVGGATSPTTASSSMLRIELFWGWPIRCGGGVSPWRARNHASRPGYARLGRVACGWTRPRNVPTTGLLSMMGTGRVLGGHPMAVPATAPDRRSRDHSQVVISGTASDGNLRAELHGGRDHGGGTRSDPSRLRKLQPAC